MLIMVNIWYVEAKYAKVCRKKNLDVLWIKIRAKTHCDSGSVCICYFLASCNCFVIKWTQLETLLQNNRKSTKIYQKIILKGFVQLAATN